MSGTGQSTNNMSGQQRLDSAAMLDGTEYTPDEFMKAQREEAEKNGLAGTSMMLNTVAMMEAKKSLRSGKTLADCPPEMFAKYPAKDGSEIKKDLTASRVVTIRNGMPNRNPAQAGFSVDPGSTISVLFEDMRD
eukprot:1650265-Rhodomonas_salina.1